MKEAKTENKMQINLPYCSHSKVEMNAKSSLAKKNRELASKNLCSVRYFNNKVKEQSNGIFIAHFCQKKFIVISEILGSFLMLI